MLDPTCNTHYEGYCQRQVVYGNVGFCMANRQSLPAFIHVERRILRIDYCDERLFYKNSDISGVRGGIIISYTSPKSYEFSLFSNVSHLSL